MPTKPGLAIATHLGTAVGALTLGTNLFHGPVRPPGQGIPVEAVFALGTGGATPETYIGGAGRKVVRPNVQVRVRSELADFDAGEDLGQTVHDAVHLAAITGYVDVLANEAKPLYLGESDAGHHEWSMNVTMWADD